MHCGEEDEQVVLLQMKASHYSALPGESMGSATPTKSPRGAVGWGALKEFKSRSVLGSTPRSSAQVKTAAIRASGQATLAHTPHSLVTSRVSCRGGAVQMQMQCTQHAPGKAQRARKE
jgi:hypothetical protein